MFVYDYKYAILLDKLRMGKISFLFESGYIIFRGTFSRLIYHIYIFYIALLSFVRTYMFCINLKGNTLNR